MTNTTLWPAPAHDDALDFFKMLSATVKEEEVKPNIVKLVQDPIALTLHYIGHTEDEMYRSRYKFSQIKPLIMSGTAVPVSAESAAMAESVRRFYRNRYMMYRLTDLPVSKYQAAAEQLIEATDEFDEAWLSILYKLPFFYLEDIATNNILSNNVSETQNHNELAGKFTFAGKVRRWGPVQDRGYKFFLCNEHKKLLIMPVASEDKSLPLWKHLYEKNASITFEGMVQVNKVKGTDFYANWVFCPNYRVEINSL